MAPNPDARWQLTNQRAALLAPPKVFQMVVYWRGAIFKALHAEVVCLHGLWWHPLWWHLMCQHKPWSYFVSPHPFMQPSSERRRWILSWLSRADRSSFEIIINSPDSASHFLSCSNIYFKKKSTKAKTTRGKAPAETQWRISSSASKCNHTKSP